MTREEYRAWLEEFAGDLPSDEDIEEGKAEIEEVREHDPEFAEKLERMMSVSLETVRYAKAKVTS